jgi:hypothetical protein
MRKPAFGNKWLDQHYDYDDPPTQASGPAEHISAPDGFRVFSVRERAPKPLGKWDIIREAKRKKYATEMAKGRLEICSDCKEFFRSNSPAVGRCVCPSCQNKTK